MLSPDRVKPLLQHEDPYVRDAAADYFADSWSTDPEVAPMILEAVRQRGPTRHSRGIAALDRLPLTEQALDGILELLAGAEEDSTIRSLNWAIANAPVELFVARRSAILDTPHFDREQLPRLERRRDLAGWSGERLWKELQDFSRRSDDAPDLDSIDVEYSDDLVEALSRHEVPDAGAICRMLRSPEVDNSWLEIPLIDLAGARRLREAVPALVDKLHVDTDFMLERCMTALARIGDPEASRLVRAAYLPASDTFKIFSSSVFGSIKHEESEEAILDLLRSEEDPTFRTILCVGLCDLFSERGIPVVTSEIESGYDTYFARLEDHLLPVLAALEIEHPQAERWKDERTKEERRLAARLAEMEREDKRYREMQAKGLDPFAKAARPKRPEAIATRCRPRRRPRSGAPGRRSAATIPAPAAAARSTRSATGSRAELGANRSRGPHIPPMAFL